MRANTGAFDLIETKELKLDVKDKKILFHLLQNSRMSFTEIAKKVGLSKESVQYRYKQLLKRGVILRTHAEVDFEKLGFQLFHILLFLDESNQKRHEELIEGLKQDPNVYRVLEFSDNWDLEVAVLARNLRDFNETQERILDPFEDIILQKDTQAVIDSAESYSFPDVRTLDVKQKEEVRKKDEMEVTYDKADLAILAELSTDARKSTYKMMGAVGLSADAIGLRIKRLVKNGLIKRFTCLLNFSGLNYQGFVFCFNAACLSKKEETHFFYHAERNPNVISVKRMLGSWDMKNYVVVKEPAMFHQFIKETKQKFSSIIRSYETWVIYKEHHNNPFPSVLG